jgi:hypothetical protein
LILKPVFACRAGRRLLFFSFFVFMFFRLIPSAPGLIFCLAVALLGQPPCARAANTVDVTGSNFYVDAKTGHIGIGTAQPASAVDAGTGEVKIGSSGAACTRAIEGAVRYANKKLQFCDGEGWRSVSTASDHP